MIKQSGAEVGQAQPIWRLRSRFGHNGMSVVWGSTQKLLLAKLNYISNFAFDGYVVLYHFKTCPDESLRFLAIRWMGWLIGGWVVVKIEKKPQPQKRKEFIDAQALFLSLRVARIKQYATDSLDKSFSVYSWTRKPLFLEKLKKEDRQTVGQLNRTYPLKFHVEELKEQNLSKLGTAELQLVSFWFWRDFV